MTSTTKNPIPAAGASFLSDLQTFLRDEDPDRFRDMFTGFIVSGGTHATGAGLVHTPASLTAYPGGHYITETGAITYPDSTTHIWVICHKDTTTPITDWTRVSGTHYLFRNTGSASTPALPVVESAILMKVTTAGGAVTVVNNNRIRIPESGGFISVKHPAFGAVGDGVTDDTVAIQAAINSLPATGGSVLFPFGEYKVSATITFTSNQTLIATTPTHGNGRSPTRIIGDLAVTPVVRYDGGGGNLPGAIRGLEITRADGTIPAGSIGLQIANTNNVKLADVLCSRHAIGYKFLAGAGLGGTLIRCHTFIISESHIIFDNTPEISLTDCRFGMNGSGDVNATNYVLITGTDPNGIYFNRCQFNLGVNTVTNCVNFVGVTGNNGLFVFESCHFEQYTNIFASDATTTIALRLKVRGCSFIVSGSLFNLDSNTTLTESNFIGNLIVTSVTLIKPDRVIFVGNNCNSPLVLTGGSSASATFSDNIFLSGTTLSGAWDALNFSNNVYRGVGASLTDTSTGVRSIFGNVATDGVGANDPNIIDNDMIMPNTKTLRWLNAAGTSSANFGITGDVADNLRFDVPTAGDVFPLFFGAAQRGQFQAQNSGLGLNFVGESSSDHVAPSANGAVIYTTDTGGKTQLVVRFNSGAVQQIAVEP